MRAAHCNIAPGVDSVFKTLGQFNAIFGSFWPPDWSVAGQNRATARLVSQIDGRSAYGGTPSDASVKEGIIDLRARGLSVVFSDIPRMKTEPERMVFRFKVFCKAIVVVKLRSPAAGRS